MCLRTNTSVLLFLGKNRPRDALNNIVVDENNPASKPISDDVACKTPAYPILCAASDDGEVGRWNHDVTVLPSRFLVFIPVPDVGEETDDTLIQVFASKELT